MISQRSDQDFKRWLDFLERSTPRLLSDPHYGPMLRAEGGVEELEAARIEWRERQERARARRLREEATWADG